ncbi:hypothetical protein CYMTET_32257 [Cymbomonas tetramitiformis]|uniref:Uncharacterized protein n=1 Tax=Cymbomonas tetramitiformis TaxID=36881 RepID=A0AAE0FG48_9CHLO|nr:hypothetical protein CYMTET_32257 [Cymbomonas tetramitiformis]
MSANGDVIDLCDSDSADSDSPEVCLISDSEDGSEDLAEVRGEEREGEREEQREGEREEQREGERAAERAEERAEERDEERDEELEDAEEKALKEQKEEDSHNAMAADGNGDPTKASGSAHGTVEQHSTTLAAAEKTATPLGCDPGRTSAEGSRLPSTSDSATLTPRAELSTLRTAEGEAPEVLYRLIEEAMQSRQISLGLRRMLPDGSIETLQRVLDTQGNRARIKEILTPLLGQQPAAVPADDPTSPSAMARHITFNLKRTNPVPSPANCHPKEPTMRCTKKSAKEVPQYLFFSTSVLKRPPTDPAPGDAGAAKRPPTDPAPGDAGAAKRARVAGHGGESSAAGRRASYDAEREEERQPAAEEPKWNRLAPLYTEDANLAAEPGREQRALEQLTTLARSQLLEAQPAAEAARGENAAAAPAEGGQRALEQLDSLARSQRAKAQVVTDAARDENGTAAPAAGAAGAENGVVAPAEECRMETEEQRAGIAEMEEQHGKEEEEEQRVLSLFEEEETEGGRVSEEEEAEQVVSEEEEKGGRVSEGEEEEQVDSEEEEDAEGESEEEDDEGASEENFRDYIADAMADGDQATSDEGEGGAEEENEWGNGTATGSPDSIENRRADLIRIAPHHPTGCQETAWRPEVNGAGVAGCVRVRDKSRGPHGVEHALGKSCPEMQMGAPSGAQAGLQPPCKRPAPEEWLPDLERCHEVRRSLHVLTFVEQLLNKCLARKKNKRPPELALAGPSQRPAPGPYQSPTAAAGGGSRENPALRAEAAADGAGAARGGSPAAEPPNERMWRPTSTGGVRHGWCGEGQEEEAAAEARRCEASGTADTAGGGEYKLLPALWARECGAFRGSAGASHASYRCPLTVETKEAGGSGQLTREKRGKHGLVNTRERGGQEGELRLQSEALNSDGSRQDTRTPVPITAEQRAYVPVPPPSLEYARLGMLI